MDPFWQAPPVSRTLAAATFVVSLLFWSGLTEGWWIAFDPKKVFWTFPPQIWRLFTSFMLTGPRLDFVFDLFNLWRFSSALEERSGRFSKPGDYFIYILFVGTVILLTAGLFLNSAVHLHALTTGLCWTYAQDNRGTKVSFFMFSIPVIYLPWAMLVITMVRNGFFGAVIEFTGIIGAHLYDFHTRIYPAFGGGRNYISTPQFVRRFFSKHTPRSGYRGYGTAFHQPDQSASASQAQSSGTDASDRNWGNWGSGRRLG
ncbi:hypothetical protein N7462_002779 [Penicillium macrosclerotiorum]|uniref:uncharacterized protein n=1 Tax=Penicillium macrosclerotiorum TaxID=303699 RepID=UPI002549940F|nr:uncharacterized protein N7462_002779 [Penicillium macrosclerotiorum]KAJ5693356.1 hypothetical protein N7462_002779 [Penicillium macrosclerotiorum]